MTDCLKITRHGMHTRESSLTSPHCYELTNYSNQWYNFSRLLECYLCFVIRLYKLQYYEDYIIYLFNWYSVWLFLTFIYTVIHSIILPYTCRMISTLNKTKWSYKSYQGYSWETNIWNCHHFINYITLLGIFAYRWYGKSLLERIQMHLIGKFIKAHYKSPRELLFSIYMIRILFVGFLLWIQVKWSLTSN